MGLRIHHQPLALVPALSASQLHSARQTSPLVHVTALYSDVFLPNDSAAVAIVLQARSARRVDTEASAVVPSCSTLPGCQGSDVSD